EPRGIATTFEYDDLGRKRFTRYQDGTFEEWNHFDDGQRMTYRNRRGKITEHQYDDLGRLKKTIFPGPEGHVTTREYYDDGQLKTVTNTRNKSTTYLYDGANRLWKVTDPLL